MSGPPFRAILLICLMGCANTVSLGAFPAVVADIASTRGLSDAQLGLLASAFGFARVLADLPVGVLAARRLRTAMIIAPVLMATGIGCLVAGGSFGTLVIGRGLIGIGHACGMVGGLTAILRLSDARRTTSALSVFELGGMGGVLFGMLSISVLPAGLAWNHAFLIASLPQAVGLALLLPVLRSLPRDAAAQRQGAPSRQPPYAGTPGRPAPRVWLAYPAAALMAFAWSSTTQFVIPLRGAREFSLDRPRIASLLLVPQVADILCLIPLGLIADRLRPARLLGGVTLVLASAILLVWFAWLPLVITGCALLGVAMAGWMLPLAIVRRHASPDRMARRTSIYRIAVDCGIFAGPLLSGLLGESRTGPLGLLIVACLIATSFGMLRAIEGRHATHPAVSPSSANS
jgi:predicted MFS family arabinose efflux permease